MPAQTLRKTKKYAIVPPTHTQRVTGTHVGVQVADMGWKYPSHLTPAQRRLLARVEADPFYTPRSSATRKRYKAMLEQGFIVIASKRTGKAKVVLP